MKFKFVVAVFLWYVPLFASAEDMLIENALSASLSNEKFQVSKPVDVDLPVHEFRWTAAAPNSSKLYRDGVTFKTLSGDHIDLACTVRKSDKYSIVTLFVVNRSDHPINVLPEHVFLNSSNSVDLGDAAKSKARTAHTLAYITHGNYSPGQGYTPPVRSSGTQSGYISGNTYRGSSDSVTYRRPSLVGLLASRAAKGADATREVTKNLLKVNTIFPGDNLTGDIIFAFRNDSSEPEIKVNIDESTFYF